MLTKEKQIISVGKEVKPSIATVCVCVLLLHVEHYNMFRLIWAIIRKYFTILEYQVLSKN
jgi:hypothetical protein